MHKVKCYFTYEEMTGEGEEWLVCQNTLKVIAKLYDGAYIGGIIRDNGLGNTK